MLDKASPNLRVFCLINTLILTIYLPGSSLQAAEYILAEVGDQKITETELKIFSEPIPEGFYGGKTALETDRALLESLIDKKLLLMEAQSKGIENEPWFSNEMAQFRKQRVLKLYRHREINEKVVITEEELLQHYRDTNRDRALRIAGILLATKEEALEVFQELKSGADFHQLAIERSLYEQTREQGGDVGEYQRKDDTAPSLREHIFRLQVGEVSEPLPFTYKGEKHYTIIKILDEIPAPLADSKEEVEKEVYAQKCALREEALRESLTEKYAPQIHFENVQFLLRRSTEFSGDRIELAESEGRLILCSYNGGHIALKDFLESVPADQRTQQHFADSTWVVDLLQGVVIPTQLFLEEAYADKLHEDPQILASLASEREDLLVSTLRQREVDQYIPATTAEEAREFYDKHSEKFSSFENIVVIEVLVAFKDQAQSLKKQIEEGADIERLARDFTIRKGMAHHGGRLTLNKFTQYRYPGLYELAQELEVGAIGGPVKLKDGYSVFKMLERKLSQKKPFDEESQRRAKAYVRIDKAKQGYVNYVRGLRQKYPVKVFVENLQKIHSSGGSASGS